MLFLLLLAAVTTVLLLAAVLYLSVNSSNVVAALKRYDHWKTTRHVATDLHLFVVYITPDNKWIISRSDPFRKCVNLIRRGLPERGFAKRNLSHLPYNTWHEVLIDVSQPRRIIAFNYNPFPKKQALVEQIFPHSLANLIFEYVVRKL